MNRFDIFSGGDGTEAVWMESVEGISNAHKRMEELAQQAPGKYFVFSYARNSTLAQIDTTLSASE